MDDKHKQTIGFQIKVVSNLIKRKIDKVIDDSVQCDDGVDITGMQGWMIGYIYHHQENGDVFQRDIEKEFRIRRSTATGLLQLLEKKEYIQRIAVLYDARLKKIVLTEKAKKAHEQIMKNIDKTDEIIEKGITDEERETFLKVIEKIKSNLE